MMKSCFFTCRFYRAETVVIKILGAPLNSFVKRLMTFFAKLATTRTVLREVSPSESYQYLRFCPVLQKERSRARETLFLAKCRAEVPLWQRFYL